MPTADLTKGAVEGVIEGLANLGGSRISRKRRRRVNRAAYALILDAEFVSQRGELKLPWVHHRLVHHPDKKVAKAVYKLMKDPTRVGKMIEDLYGQLKRLSLLGVRSSELDLTTLPKT